MADRCASCGAILPEGAKLCTSCGKIVTKNTRLRTENHPQRKAAPDVQTGARVYSHKPTPTAVMDLIGQESAPKRESEPPQAKKAAGAKPKSKKQAKKKTSKGKFIAAFLIFIAVLLLLLFMLIYTLGIREAKNLTYTPESSVVKLSFDTYGEAAENFFSAPEWSYNVFSGQASVSGKNKGTTYKYVFEDGKVVCVYVGEEKLTEKKEIDILVQRMFI